MNEENEGLVLNLTGADTSGGDFEAVRAGTYDASVFEVKLEKTQGGEGKKLPAGTPMLNIQFRLTGEDSTGQSVENRRVFRRYTIPPKEINGTPYEHYDKLNGMLVKLLAAIGYDEAEVTGGSFQLDREDMEGRECKVTVTKKQRVVDGQKVDIWDNDVVAVRPITATAESASATALL